MVKNLFVKELSPTANIISIQENDFIIETQPSQIDACDSIIKLCVLAILNK